MIRLHPIQRQLRAMASAEQAAILRRFFKTGPGEYGDGDEFLGVKVPAIRQLVRQTDGVDFTEVKAWLRSAYHEDRLLALLVCVRRFERGDPQTQRRIFGFYLASTAFVNNWDLVDTTAPQIVGGWLRERSRERLDALARSENLWERRIAVLATLAFIRRGEFGDTLRLCRRLLSDPQDLMHKACGWMLREVGKRDHAVLENFLVEHSGQMPRTLLRYAIERFPEPQRLTYLQMGRPVPKRPRKEKHVPTK